MLVAALARLRHLPWQLAIAGDCGRSAQTYRQVKADIARLGLADRISLLGAVASDQLAPLYASADLFVLPSRFEGYGMAFTDAIAFGVPVVGAIGRDSGHRSGRNRRPRAARRREAFADTCVG